MFYRYFVRFLVKYSSIFVLSYLFCSFVFDERRESRENFSRQSLIENKSLTMNFSLRSTWSSSDEKEKLCHIVSPSRIQLDYNNIYWQQFDSSNGTFYFLNAFYDIRSSLETSPTVRIVSMINRLSPPKVFCQIWFHNSSISVRTVATYHYIWFERWGNHRDEYLQPYLINCPLYKKKTTKSSLQPRFVSIYQSKCSNLTNQLEIDSNYFSQLNDKVKKKFSVCVKALDFPSDDLSFRLIEWIELIRLLGGTKITFYQFDVQSNIDKVLKYYQNESFVDVHRLTLPGRQPNLHSIRRNYFRERVTTRRQHEIIPYNDCFYRNLYEFEFVLLIDIDEIILPKKDFNWIELFQRIQTDLNEQFDNYAAFSARNIYFFPEDPSMIDYQLNSSMKELYRSIQSNFYMLKQIQRSNVYNRPGAYVKTFFRTSKVIGVHNHFPLGCFSTCRRYEFDVNVAHLQHYRTDCVRELRKTCEHFRNNSVLDSTIWKYRQKLIEQTISVRTKLNFND